MTEQCHALFVFDACAKHEPMEQFATALCLLDGPPPKMEPVAEDALLLRSTRRRQLCVAGLPKVHPELPGQERVLGDLAQGIMSLNQDLLQKGRLTLDEIERLECPIRSIATDQHVGTNRHQGTRIRRPPKAAVGRQPGVENQVLGAWESELSSHHGWPPQSVVLGPIGEHRGVKTDSCVSWEPSTEGLERQGLVVVLQIEVPVVIQPAPGVSGVVECAQGVWQHQQRTCCRHRRQGSPCSGSRRPEPPPQFLERRPQHSEPKGKRDGEGQRPVDVHIRAVLEDEVVKDRDQEHAEGQKLDQVPEEQQPRHQAEHAEHT